MGIRLEEQQNIEYSAFHIVHVYTHDKERNSALTISMNMSNSSLILRSMMIRYRQVFLVPLLCLSFGLLLAQTEQSFNHQIKLSLFLNVDKPNGGLTFGTLAPAYVIRTDSGMTHTLEFHKLTWNTTEYATTAANNRGLALRHQADFPIGPQWHRFQFTVGSSVRLSYYQSRAEPKVATVFHTAFYEGEVALGAIPAIHIYPIGRFDLSLGTLLEIVDFQFSSNRTSNPVLPIRQRRTDVFGYGTYFLRFQSLVVGLAYQF